MYKIFINNIPVWLVSKSHSLDIPQRRDFMQMTYRNIKELLEILEYIETSKELKQVYLTHDDVEQLKEDVFYYHKVLEAAGGLVFNLKDELLLIQRNGFWDIPKGHIEKGEKQDEAAMREVEEETGIASLELMDLICYQGLSQKATWHTYKIKKKRHLKLTYWYEMYSEQLDGFVPQKEEKIEKVEWVKFSEVENRMKDSFHSLWEVISNAQLFSPPA